MKPKRNALIAVGAANQGKDGDVGKTVIPVIQKSQNSRLSMMERRVTPRGLFINAGRAFA